MVALRVGPARDVDPLEPVHGGHPVPLAVALVSPPAGIALAARLEHLQGHAVTALHAPALRGTVAELLHDPDGLVAWDEGPAGVELAGVLLVVGAAQPARLDAEEPVVGPDPGEVERPLHQVSWRLQHEGAGVV